VDLDSGTLTDPAGSAPRVPAAGTTEAAPERRPVWTTRNVLIATLCALGVGAIAVAAWSLSTGGIGWDAPTDTTSALQVRAIPSSDSLTQAYNAVDSSSEFYGVFIQQSADLLHRILTGSTQRLQPYDATTNLYQGGFTLALSVLSVAALAIAVGYAFRSALAAAFAWSLTLATPLWLGLSHLDFKDVPVAAGLNLVSAGLILSIAIQTRRKATLLAVLLAGSGASVALATRPGSLLLLAAFFGTTCAAFGVWAWWRGRPRAVLPSVIAAIAAIPTALAVVWATNPIARIDLVQWLHQSSQIALAYPWNDPILVAGHNLRAGHLPWWYVPAWLGAQLPLLTIVALVVGLGVLGAAIFRRRVTTTGNPADADRMITLVPLALQAIVIPVGILLSGAVIYDGIRHVLFMVPALIALAAAGLALLDRRLASRRGWRIVLPLLATLAVAASLLDSARWAPYAYAYINPIAGHNTRTQSWELDFWGASAREGVARLHKDGLTSVAVQPSEGVGLPFGGVRYTGTFGPNAGIYVFSRWGLTAASFGCTVLFTIKRDGHELGEGAKCPPHTTTAGFPG
jgi:hypothetical protein